MTFPTSSQILTDLAEVAGWTATMEIVKLRGGVQIRIPAEATEDHWLTFAVGKEAAAKICAHYGGSHLWIPKNEADLLRLRNGQIAQDRAAGTTINALAQKWRLTDRQIYNILGAIEDA